MSRSKAKGKRPNRPPSFLCVSLRTWRLCAQRCAQRRQVRKGTQRKLGGRFGRLPLALLLDIIGSKEGSLRGSRGYFSHGQSASVAETRQGCRRPVAGTPRV